MRASVVLQSTHRASVQESYRRLLGSDPITEFRVPDSELMVTVFPGFSVLSGPADALVGVRDLRATLFVDSLKETVDELLSSGWKKEGSLGSSPGVLLRDLEGNLLEFVEERGAVSGAEYH